MKEIAYTIKEHIGFNPRRALLFTGKMQQFSSNITITRGNDACNGKNIYGLLNMQIRRNETITVQAAGVDEETAINTAYVFLKQMLQGERNEGTIHQDYRSNMAARRNGDDV
ncbi:MAG: HPr family phosphocarrier protein [Treponema sp.]|jgi:phosphotransferase system HPr (HPr) family protein|nr:HPr family phosphocarrier protein [Treponema sp.]